MCKECKEVKQEKKENIRKVFLDDLPRKYGIGANKDILIIDWLKSVGMLVRFIYDDIEGWAEIISYTSKGQILYIKYEDKEPFRIKTNHFINCKLGELLQKRTIEFKVEIGTTFKDNKRDLVIIGRDYKKDNNGRKWKWYEYKCNKCGWEHGLISEGDLMHGNGCSCCKGVTVVEGINDIPTTAPWMIKFFADPKEAKLHTKASHKKIRVKCPDCGVVKDKLTSIYKIYENHSISCTCGDGYSYGHKYVYNLLTQLNLSFNDNKTFDWCIFPSYKDKLKTSKGEYDFIIEDLKLIIEVDGDFHRKDNTISGQTKEESVYLDDMKDLLAEQNGYRVIRVSDEDNIKDNIINSELINSFDLSKIDWNKCEEFALSNRVKEACELKKNNPDMTTGDIGKIMNIHYGNIKKYLVKGSELGWCKYDTNEESLKIRVKNGKANSKPIKIFKDGVLLGIFNSVNELEKQSNELFGVKLSAGKISMVCRQKRNHHKGYTFEYI